MEQLRASPIGQRIEVIRADEGFAGVDWVAQVQGHFGWRVEIIRKPRGQKGFAVLPRRWIIEQTFSCRGRYLFGLVHFQRDWMLKKAAQIEEMRLRALPLCHGGCFPSGNEFCRGSERRRRVHAQRKTLSQPIKTGKRWCPFTSSLSTLVFSETPSYFPTLYHPFNRSSGENLRYLSSNRQWRTESNQMTFLTVT